MSSKGTTFVCISHKTRQKPLRLHTCTQVSYAGPQSLLASDWCPRLSDRAEVQACTCFLQCLQSAISVLQQLVYCPSSQYVFVLDGADLVRICNLACSEASNDSLSGHPFVVAEWMDVFLCISDRPSAFRSRVKPTATSAPSIHPLEACCVVDEPQMWVGLSK
jgi:hypothetical protein